MIAISIFLVVVTVGMGALLNANSLHKKSQDMRSIIDNLSFIMEDMSRSLRTGYSYQCFRKNIDTTLSPATLGVPRNCNDGWAIAFEHASGEVTTYSDQSVYYINSGKIFRSNAGATSDSFVQLTPDEVVLDSVSGFFVVGAEAGDIQQPFVTIKLVGSITSKGITSPFSLQTSVSQRALDI